MKSIIILFLLSMVHSSLVYSQSPVYINPEETDKFILDPADFDPDDENTMILKHEPFGNKKEAVYTLDQKADGTPVIRAESNQAISSITSNITADPNLFRFIEWEWKINNVLESGDLTEKSGDDFPARIYVTFDYPPSELSFGQRIKYSFYKTFTSFEIPLRSLNYVWASKAEVGTITSNPYTDWVKYVVVESGNEKSGQWIQHKRDLLNDYREAFGEEPNEITGITIMTDSDNTGESTLAWFGKIVLSKSERDSTELNEDPSVNGN